MKKIVLLLLALSLVLAMTACDIIAQFHYCESACPECGGCQDLECFVSTCANKCQGHDDVHKHSLTKVDEKSATCLESGLEEYFTCECGKMFADAEGKNEIEAPKVIEALGHTEVTVAGKAATCTEAGLTTGKKCSACGETLLAQKEIAALGHKTVTDAAVAATCTEAGLSAGEHCIVCDYKVAQEVVPALGHTLVVDAGKDATCTEAGLTAGEHCTVCDYKVAQETVSALGHTIVKDEAKAATCTESGLTEGEHCTVCDYKVEQETVPALGHTNADAVVENNVAPTCTVVGSYDNVVYCSVCNTELSRNNVVVDALGHTDEVVPGKAATCTETGLTEGKKCSACGETLVAQDVILATGHVYDDDRDESCNNCDYVRDVECLHENKEALGEAKAATCTEEGLTAGEKCVDCGEIIAVQEVVAALGHTEQTVAGKAATCTEAGLTDGKMCSVCGVTLADQEEIPAKGHTLVNHECACGYYDLGENVTVYFENNWLWTNVSVYYWYGKNQTNNAGWPGEALTKVVGKVNGHDVYEIVIPANITGFIINGVKNDGSGNRDQTPDIKSWSDCVCYSMTWNNGNAVVTNEYHINDVVTVDPDCTNPGSETTTCKVCGKTDSKELPAKGHSEELVAGKDATCTEAGLTNGKKCTACGETLEAQEEIPALGHNEVLVYDNNGHWVDCDRCDYVGEKVAHSEAEAGKCACGFACADKCELCGKCEDKNCKLCANKCEFAVSNTVIPFAPSATLGTPEGPNGLAPGKDGAYIMDESITATHVVLENGAHATVITLPNGTAAHSGVSLQANKNFDAYGKAGFNSSFPQIANITLNVKLYFTNNGDSTVTFTFSAIDYYYDKGAVTVTLNPGETKTVLMPTTYNKASVGLNHQIVFPEGAEAGASISVWGEFVANQNLSGVTVATAANQLRFGVGETFSAEGLVLKANGTSFDRIYISGNYTTNFDGYTFTSADVGTKTVFVMFGDYAVTYTITVDDHDHNVVYVDQQDPVQCEKDGLAAHYACTVCGTKFADKYGNKILVNIESVSCHTAPTSGVVPGTAISCVHCGTAMGIASMDNWVHFAITTQTSSIGSNIKNGKLEHGYVEGIPGTKIYIGAGTKGATNDSAFYLKMSDNDSGWQTVIPNLGSNAPSGQLRKVILFYVNYSNEAVTLNLQNDAKGGNGKVTIPANGTAVCEFTIKNAGGSNWFYLYVDSNPTTDVVIGMYGYFYVYNEEVDSISVNKQAEKLTYKVGETFSSKGLIVNVPITMNNSKTCYANTGFTTNYDGRTFTADDLGTHTVTVTFGDNTTTYVIEVVPEVDCANGEHKYDKVSDESFFVEMQGNNAIYKKVCVYCGAVSEETYVADTIAFVPHAADKTEFLVEYVVLEDGRIAVKLTAKIDIAAGKTVSISTNVNNAPTSTTNVVFPVSGNGRRVYMEMLSNANVSITWQPEFYGDRDGVTMELVAGEAQSNVWVIKYDAKAGYTSAALPYEEFVFNSDVAAGTEIYITGMFYDRGDILDVHVNTPASKIVYNVGDEFSSAGFSFGVTSTDSLFDKVTIYNVTTSLDGYTFTEADSGKTFTVTVYWGEFEYTYDVFVK